MNMEETFESLIGQVNKDLVTYVETEVLPCYEGVDPAHDQIHVRTVLGNALSLAAQHKADLNMVYAIACYHDIGIRYGRDDHEITSARWLKNDRKLDSFFSPKQIEIMAQAIEDHRASSGHAPRSLYGCIIAEADRDITPMRILKRSLQFAKAHHPGVSDEEVVRISLAHIKEKYGPNGYLKLYLNDPRNEKGLTTLREWLATGEMEQLLTQLVRELD